MALTLSESLVLAKTRSQDLKSILKFNCWNSGLADIGLVRRMVNVEIIGLSQNEITTLEDFAYCPKLKELTLRSNKISNIAELAHLQGLPNLKKLWLAENPCVENTHNYRKVVLKNLPNLTVLDNIPVSKEELQEIEELGNEIYEEIPYESTTSSGSSTANNRAQDTYDEQAHHYTETKDDRHIATLTSNNNNTQDHELNEASCFMPTPDTNLNQSYMSDVSLMTPNNNNNSQTGALGPRTPHNQSRLSMISEHQQLGRVPSQASLNGSQHQGWSSTANNNMLPKGGKNSYNILSAVLCLVKELNLESCEVVLNCLHCRMEELRGN